METEASASVGEVGQSRKVGAVPPWPDLPVGDWIALLACCLDTWAGPGVCALSAWAERLLGSRSTRDLGFMNPTECASIRGQSCLPCDSKKASKKRGSI